VKKEDTMFKVKYDPDTDTTIVKDTKYARAMERAAENVITIFEEKYPEYFTGNRYKSILEDVKKHSGFSMEHNLQDTDEVPIGLIKFKELKKLVKEEENEDILQQIY